MESGEPVPTTSRFVELGESVDSERAFLLHRGSLLLHPANNSEVPPGEVRSRTRVRGSAQAGDEVEGIVRATDGFRPVYDQLPARPACRGARQPSGRDWLQE